MNAPLAGLGVAVTRPAGSGDALAARLTTLGANVLLFPAIVLEPAPLSAEAADLLEALEGFDWAVFISPGAVACFTDLRRQREWPAGVRTAAVGTATAASLRAAGAGEVVVPAAGDGAAALLATPDFAAGCGERVLIVRGEGGRVELAETLAARGAEVSEVALYRRVPPADGARLFDWLRAQPRPALLVTSVTALEHLESLAQSAEERTLLHAAQLVVASRRVVKQAEILDYRHISLAADAGDAALTAALLRWWSPEHS
jgi:uroporphyrinogen-III synthase